MTRKNPKDHAMEVSRLLFNEHDLLLTLKDKLVRAVETGELTIDDAIWQAFGMGGDVVFHQAKGE